MSSSRNGKSADADITLGIPHTALPDAPWRTPGYLMVIGGADRLDPDARLGRLFVGLVERAMAHSGQRDIVLVSTATRHPEVLTSEYVRIFSRIGVPRDRIHTPFIRTREEAQHADNVRLLSESAGIFITGGDQYALAQILDRTPAEEAIREAYQQGAVIAGTSAGATAMGRPMVVAGGGSGELRMGIVQMSHGLGWVGDDIIIDTHFGARGRFPRLASAVAEHPSALGIGIDENTCLLVDGLKHCTVAGAGVVYFLDATGVEVNTAHEGLTGHPISVGPLRVTALAGGGEYDLRARQILLSTMIEG